MPEPLATVVVTPREQFSKAKRSLDSLLKCTAADIPIVYVDGNSPRAIAQYIQARAMQRNFEVLRSQHYLGANQARNIGLQRVRTKYVAFVDNDVSFTPDWLETLLACAQETGAWAVGPLYLIGEPERRIVHMAGADLRIIQDGPVRRLHEQHRFSNMPVERVRNQLLRERTGLVEFHCMLVLTEVFDRVGLLDEKLISFLDHVDFCLAIANAGGSVYIEPAAVVAHLAPPPYAWYDLPYFFLRFSDAWMESSVRRFAEKHDLALSDAEFDGHRRFRNAHRLRLLGRIRGAMRRLGGHRAVAIADAFFNTIVDRLVEPSIVRRLEWQRQKSSPFASPAQASKGV